MKTLSILHDLQICNYLGWTGMDCLHQVIGKDFSECPLAAFELQLQSNQIHPAP